MMGIRLDDSPASVSRSIVLIALVFVIAGVMHLLKTDVYVRIVPPWLPAPRMLVIVSGIFQILGGIGVLLPVTRVTAGWGLVALLVAVTPANVQMYLTAHSRGASILWQAALLARLPLQALLIWWVWRAAVRPAP